MAFTSFRFLLFICVVTFVYFILPLKHRWISLLFFSFLFYGLLDIRYIIFLLFTIISTFYTGTLLQKYNDEYIRESKTSSKQNKKILKNKYKFKKKKLLFLGVMSNLLILVIVKYTNDFFINLNSVFSFLKVDIILNPITILVPLGISYYIFQSIGYLVDIYREKYSAESNIFKYALFVSFFPQLVQGPISRFDTLGDQLIVGHAFDVDRTRNGSLLVLWGFFLKLVIADRIGIMVNSIFNNFPQYLGSYVIWGGFAYSIQVYTDFSGGINIAKGVAEILGINLPDNFRRPYFATSLQEYWRRWHISLNDWLRDYVFYPISLSKTFVNLGKSARKTFGTRFGKNFAIYIATMVVRLIMAIWHGLSWKYIVQGLFHGFLITAGIQFAPQINSITKKLKIRTDCFSWKLFQIVRTFTLAGIARIMVRATNLSVAWSLIRSIFTVYNPWIWVDGSLFKLGISAADFCLLVVAMFILLFISSMQEKGIHIREKLSEQNLIFQWGLIYFMIFSIIIWGIYGPEYDSSAFIYQQF